MLSGHNFQKINESTKGIPRLNHLQWTLRQKKYERAILKTFKRATAAQIIDGKQWYPRAIEAMAAIDSPILWGPETRAAITAILSPRIFWKQNLKNLRKVHAAVSRGDQRAPVMGGINRNIDKAYDVAMGRRSLEAVTGPKVSAFHANLTGNFERVTLDTWAARAAGITDGKAIERKRYRYLEKAYQNVARELGFLPAELQAICWIVIRGSGE